MISHHVNRKRLHKDSEAEALHCVRNLANWSSAVAEVHTWPEYAPQPMRSLPMHAKELGVSRLLIKDESRRFGTDLASYKTLGAPYAVFRVLAKEVQAQEGTLPSSTDIRLGKYRHITEQVTVCVSTDGNQGRALAFGAQLLGCCCVIYIHKDVNLSRTQKMKNLGAIVIRVDGDHKASVDRAIEDARMNGWHYISSTSWDDFDGRIPQSVMSGFMVLVEEAIDAIDQLQEITHVLVCGGMGSISARIFLGLYEHFQTHYSYQGSGKARLPRFIVVEPSEADCILESAKSGSLQKSKHSLSTVMAGLACRIPSPAAFKLLSWLASDFVAVPDSVAVSGMKALADAQKLGDVPVVCGESSAATMGLLLEASKDPILREQLGLDSESQVVLFGLEGATDPEMYQKLVGVSPETVFNAQKLYLSKH